MKKIIAVCAFLFCAALSFSAENFISGEYSFQLYWKNTEFSPTFIGSSLNNAVFNGKKTRLSSVISMTSESYYSVKWVGIYAGLDLIIPHKITVSMSNNIELEMAFPDVAIGIGARIGPAFRLPLAFVDIVFAPFFTVDLLSVVGSYTYAGRTAYSAISTSYGFGLDLRVRFNITPDFYISTGVVGKFNFFDREMGANAKEGYLNEKTYISGSVAPVIAFGWHFSTRSFF